MSLFKKPNRKFRQREIRNDSEDEAEITEASDSKGKSSSNDSKLSFPTEISRTGTVSASSSAENKIDTAPKCTKLLSFHDEEEEETEIFKLKKSTYSRRLAKQREKERRKKEETVTPSPPVKDDVEVIKIVPITEKKPESKSKESWDVLAGNDAEDMEVESDGENEKVNPFKNVLQSGVIPDAATIYAMKKHRQMAREMGDFIPVEDTEKEEESKSRLIRDDDNDRSDDDDDEPSRINFTINTGAVERQKMRETFLSLQEGSSTNLETEEAAELERWEREQIKKGVGVTQVGPLETSQGSEGQLYTYSQVNVDVSSFIGDANEQSSVSSQKFPAELLKPKEVNLTTKDIKARLEERLEALKAMHEAHEQEFENCTKEMIEAAELVKKLAEEAPVRERNFSLYQRLSGYVQDLVECMDLKSAHIDLLEGRMVDLYKVRAQKLATRRQLDVRDQSDEFSTLSNELLKGINVEFLSEKNSCSDEPRLRRAAEREGRRMRRRKKRERQSISNSIKHQDGVSSDDEEPDIDIIQFKAARENILNEAGSIFEDVVEDFGTLEGIMTNFENWKIIQVTSYSEAYVPLCLPKIFGIFVKLALLDWNPLEESREFEKSSWYQQILQYGCDCPSVEDKDDPDINLLPGIMERIILPKITSYVQKVWNPLSTSETNKLVHLVKDMYETYPTVNGKSKQLINLLQAVTVKIYKSLDDDIFIPLYPKELLENRSLGAADFFQRQFWSAVKLFQNILTWDGLISEQPLQQMALGSLLNRYLMMGLHTSSMMKDTLDKCKTIVNSLPKSWLKNIKAGSTLPLLKQFSLYLLKYADIFSSLSSKRGLLNEETKEGIKDIVQLLVTIEALDDAVSLAKKYSVSAFKNS